ncbi:MAG: DEAD/DEAH box helicase [Arcobacteraceae bacterium]|jgi:ATP-dependent RNA helicase DeaD|nr:DEAD/DEAH box helicase [Arcobacteraceae bacterium]MDY0365499.1 DEAD/DEAH box helicase [Arcobacteraceae bacterium]
MTFEEFGFKSKLLDSIKDAGFKEPSPIQKEAIPVVLQGKDIVAQAHTGTGKTAAFGLPILEQLSLNGGVEAVVIVPTRELAVQVSDELFRFGKFLGIKTATVYGGSSYTRQIRHIEHAAIVVATPGRFLDLLNNEQIDINPSFVVLDEADEMLDMGFLEDIKSIFKFLPSNRQTLMFSATMPKEIKELAKTILNEPSFVSITTGEVTNKQIKQHYYVVEEHERDDALIRLLDYKNPKKSIIFCRMKKEVDRLSTFLVSQGYSAKGLHGDMEQRQREEVIKSFKGGNLEILIATDVAARGLDVNDVSHVFNYHIPFESESYVHRIGRTGRAGKEGLAISLVTPHEFNSLVRIQKSVGATLESRVVPTISEVKEKNKTELGKKIANQNINEHALHLVEELKEQFDISTIAYKLASIIYEEQEISGKEIIGKGSKELKRLLDNYKEEKSSKSKSRGGKRGFGDRSRSKRPYDKNRKDSTRSHDSKNYKKSSSKHKSM